MTLANNFLLNQCSNLNSNFKKSSSSKHEKCPIDGSTVRPENRKFQSEIIVFLAAQGYTRLLYRVTNIDNLYYMDIELDRQTLAGNGCQRRAIILLKNR